MVRLQVMGPPAGMLVTGVLAIIFWAGNALIFAMLERNWWRGSYMGYAYGSSGMYEYRAVSNFDHLLPDLAMGAILGSLVLVVGGIILFGARRLMKLQGLAWVFLAIILCMLPWSPAIIIGLPVGIWALFVINRFQVRMAFARTALGSAHGAVATPWNNPPIEQQPTGPFRRRMRSMLLGIQSLFIGSRAETPSPTTPYSPLTDSQEAGGSSS
jgi:hypothetical protein